MYVTNDKRQQLSRKFYHISKNIELLRKSKRSACAAYFVLTLRPIDHNTTSKQPENQANAMAPTTTRLTTNQLRRLFYPGGTRGYQTPCASHLFVADGVTNAMCLTHTFICSGWGYCNKTNVRQPISGLGYGRGYIVAIARIEAV